MTALFSAILVCVGNEAKLNNSVNFAGLQRKEGSCLKQDGQGAYTLIEK